MDFLSHFWDVASELNPKASSLHGGKRFSDANADALKGVFAHTGFAKTVIVPIEIETHFRNFDDYWKPFLGGQGPAPTYVKPLNESERNNLRDALHDRLPIQSDGSISMFARAWAASSQV